MNLLSGSSYNRFPDEKGLKDLNELHELKERIEVTIVSPMKRGLKGSTRTLLTPARFVTIVSPMKRGLDSFQKGNSYTAYLRLTKAAMTFQVLP